MGSDTMSSIIDYEDRATCVIFGDGAGRRAAGARQEARRIVSSIFITKWMARAECI